MQLHRGRSILAIMSHDVFTSFFQNRAMEFLDRAIDMALEEDGQDLTSLAVFGPNAPFKADITAKQELVLAGLPIVSRTLERCGQGWDATFSAADGQTVSPGTVVARLSGPARVLLRAERTALNFLVHLSGIATLTRRYADVVQGTGTQVLDTRKTLPGLRYPEKYAVLMGGGANHRMNLEEMLMLKDNHVDLAGGAAPAVEKLRAAYAPCPPIEVECRTLDEVRAAVETGVQRVMLDNMDQQTMAQALKMIPQSMESEISGGVDLQTIRSLAELGPTYISVGRLTHSAPAADLSMRVRRAD